MPGNIVYFPNTITLVYNKADHSLSGDVEFTVGLLWVPNNPTDPFPEDNLITMTPSDSIFVLTKRPNPDAFLDSFVTVTTSGPINLEEGTYSYFFKASTPYAKDINIPVSLKIISNSDGVDPVDIVYGLKYFLEQKDLRENVIRCEILKAGYEGVTTEIRGSVVHKYQEKTDHFEPITASNLQLELESSLDLNLSELYTEDEHEYKCVLKRNDRVIFVGFIKPDGIFEDYVYDRWLLSIDVYDGLSTLKSMSFSNKNGGTFSGNYAGIDIIYNCLIRTGLNLPININCEVFYEGFLGYNSIMEYIFFNTERYFQNPSEPMDCESVLKSILQIFNCSLIQQYGEWYIYRTVDVNEIMFFYKYIDGIYSDLYSYQPSVSIGSEIDGFLRFHCRGNQKKSISPSVQAYRVTYEYGNASSLFRNGGLQLSGSGLDMDGWVVDNPDGRVERLPGGYGLTSKVFTGNSDPPLIRLNQSVDVNEGAVIKLTIRFANENINSVGLRFGIAIGTRNFSIADQQWKDEGVINFVANYSFEGWYPSGDKICKGLGDATYELTVRTDRSGPLNLTIYRDRHPIGAGDFKIYSVNVTPSDSGNIKGRDYTAQQTKKKSTVTKPNITVYNGDSQSDLFVGTIYKADEIPTTKWYRTGSPESKEVLEINAEDNIRIAPRPMMIFEGDVYGYLPFLSMISINNIPGKFLPMNYTYECGNNIVKLSNREFSSDFLNESDFHVDIKDNYGNETKVTIV